MNFEKMTVSELCGTAEKMLNEIADRYKDEFDKALIEDTDKWVELQMIESLAKKLRYAAKDVRTYREKKETIEGIKKPKYANPDEYYETDDYGDYDDED